MPTEQEITRDDKGRLVKGTASLNPSGRPKNISAIIKELSNDYEDYLVMLDKWAHDTGISMKDRIACLNMLLDRGVGKPSQHVQTEDITPEKIEYIKEDGGTKDES